MPRKIFNILISIVIVLFSFFYTNEVIKFFREKDPIMVEIKNNKRSYMDNEEATIDVDKSYQNMKRAGKYDKNLLVFEEVSNNNNYSSYISNLNNKKDAVSIIFILKNTDNIKSIIKILNKYNIKTTFFVTKELFDEYVDIIKYIIDNGNQVELLSDTYTVYEVNKYSSIIKLLAKNKLHFCLNINKDDGLLKSCESSKLYSIVPNKIINNNLYYYVKNNLNNGLILVLDNGNKNVKELSVSINYIIQKGKKILLLKNIIE